MRRFRRGWAPVVVALAVVALLAAGVAALAIHLATPEASHRATPQTTNDPNSARALHPERDGLTCPVDVAWSPDSSMFAVVGYSVCPNAPTLASARSHPQGIVLLYDAATGKRITTLHPDQQLTPVAHTLGISLATGSAPYIRFQTIMWSPDGKLIALPFFVEYTLAPRSAPFLPSTQTSLPSAIPSIAGVLLYDAARPASQPRIITAPYRENGASVEWNLATGKPVSTALPITPSLTYQWGADGELLAEAPLTALTGNAPTTPPGPVGDPAGEANFTLWQPGELAPAYLAQNSGVYTSVPGACFWSSLFDAWSPSSSNRANGSYLITPGYVSAQLSDPSLATPDPTMLATAMAATSLGNPPALAPRDATLLALCQRMMPDSSGYAATAQAIAWRPDGALLAATADPYLNNVATAQAAQNGVITLYDSATGKPVKTLDIPTNTQAPLTNLLSEQSLWLRWSPNGARLALLDLYTGTLTLWRISNLS